MGTIAEKLRYVLQTKDQIRAAIEEKGTAVPDDMPFRGYPALIGQISTGGGAIDFSNLEEVDSIDSPTNSSPTAVIYDGATYLLVKGA